MLLKGKKSIQTACRNTAGALTAAEILQTLQNRSCWRGTHSPPQRQLSRLAAQAGAAPSPAPEPAVLTKPCRNKALLTEWPLKC